MERPDRHQDPHPDRRPALATSVVRAAPRILLRRRNRARAATVVRNQAVRLPVVPLRGPVVMAECPVLPPAPAVRRPVDMARPPVPHPAEVQAASEVLLQLRALRADREVQADRVDTVDPQDREVPAGRQATVREDPAATVVREVPVVPPASNLQVLRH